MNLNKPKLLTNTSRNLFCVLTDSERLDRGRKLAELEENYDTCTVEKKAAVDSFKDRESAIEAGIKQLVPIIRDGMERRSVECEWRYHWSELTKELMRLDTGEIIETEIISAEERQIGLDLTTEN